MRKIKPKKRIIKRAKKLAKPRRSPKAKSGSRPRRASGKRKPIKKKPIKRKAVKKRVVRKKPAKPRRSPKAKSGSRPRRASGKRKPVKKKLAKKPRKRAVKRPVKRVKRPTKKVKKVVRKKPAKRRRKKTRIVRRAYFGGGPLEKLFESPAKVQTMKLFFRNPETNFLLKEAAKIMKMNLDLAKKQIKRLEKIGLLKTRQVSSRKQLFSINPNFDFFNELRELILKSSPVSKDKMLKAIRGLGKIKLVLLSGLFTGNDMARADLLVIGNSINQRKLTGFIKNLEAEAGTDINCVVMTTEEFKYRYDMYDRFVRDLLSEKSELLINRLGV